MTRILPILAVVVTTVPAMAHDDADWIMREPRYVTANGTHCCGMDCRRAEPGEVVETAPGVFRAGKSGEPSGEFREGEPGTYISRDHLPWICQYERARLPPRCIFFVGGSS